jgi:hypothetical protein
MSSIFDECEIKYHNIPSESKVFIYAYLVFIDYDKQKNNQDTNKHYNYYKYMEYCYASFSSLNNKCSFYVSLSAKSNAFDLSESFQGDTLKDYCNHSFE